MSCTTCIRPCDRYPKCVELVKTEQRFIAVYGNLVDGFSFVGPFPSGQAAQDYVDGEAIKTIDTFVCELHAPDETTDG